MTEEERKKELGKVIGLILEVEKDIQNLYDKIRAEQAGHQAFIDVSMRLMNNLTKERTELSRRFKELTTPPEAGGPCPHKEAQQVANDIPLVVCPKCVKPV